MPDESGEGRDGAAESMKRAKRGRPIATRTGTGDQKSFMFSG